MITLCKVLVLVQFDWFGVGIEHLPVVPIGGSSEGGLVAVGHLSIDGLHQGASRQITT